MNSSSSYDWDDANVECENSGGSLALRSILNNTSTILSNLSSSETVHSPFWIGLREYYEWIDGTRLENKSVQDGEGKCVRVQGNYSELIAEECSKNYSFSLCQRRKNTSKN